MNNAKAVVNHMGPQREVNLYITGQRNEYPSQLSSEQNIKGSLVAVTSLQFRVISM